LRGTAQAPERRLTIRK